MSSLAEGEPELFIVLPGTILPDIARSSTDLRVRRDLINMWVDFACQHNPTPTTATWTPFDPQSPQYLEIGER